MIDYQRFLQRFLNLHSLLATPGTPNSKPAQGGSMHDASNATMFALQDSVRATMFGFPIWEVRLMLTHAYITAFCPPYAMLCYAPYPPTEFILDSIHALLAPSDHAAATGLRVPSANQPPVCHILVSIREYSAK